MASRPGRLVEIVAGLRTPFAKAGTSFEGLSALELGSHVVAKLMQRAEIPARAIDQIVFGTVIPSVQLPNIAREVGLAAGLPKNLDADSGTPARAIDQIVFGPVIPSVQLPNIAREVGLAAGLPKNLDAYSVVRACATSLQAMTSAADAIALGENHLAGGGGAGGRSDVP